MIDDLREVAQACADAKGYAPLSDTELTLRLFVKRHAAQIEQDARDAEEIQSTLPGVYYMDPPDGGSMTVADQFRRMAEDAARYRFLRNDTYGLADKAAIKNKCSETYLRFGTDLDSAIDAAMAQESGK
jgi:hypothetical protein